jgi:Leucine-rich repeat (LRR) protein
LDLLYPLLPIPRPNIYSIFPNLQAQLIQLHLSGNRLEQIPSWALTYLRQLQNLKLEGNQIEQIGADTFAETHLPNLRYFHLDGNRVGMDA